MEPIAGMKRTGRKLAGPGGHLIEVVSADDLKHTAVVFDGAYRDLRCLNSDLEATIGFMEAPDVTGLSRLVAHQPEAGAFVYPTGTVWSVAELVRELADLGEVGGIKAGLELCYLTAEILVDASDKGSMVGVSGHGSLDPWRAMVKADGQVSVVGFGLPRPEVEVFLEDEHLLPSEDGFRYCAPECFKPDGIVDISSDLFSLTLVALELMVGRPVYDGLVADVRQKASRGEAVRKLYQWRERIPEVVRDVLGKALKPDRDARYRDGLDYVYSVHDLLGGIDSGEGPSLRQLVSTVRDRQRRGTAVVGGNTGALTKAELAELARSIDDDDDALPSPRRPRPAGEEEVSDKPRWRRATRNAPDESRPSARSRRGDADGSAGGARDRLLNRLRGRGEEPEEPRRRRRPGPTPPAEPEAERPRRRSRAKRSAIGGRRRSSPKVLDEEETIVAGVTPEVVDVEVEEVRPSRRRRPGGRAAALLERLRSNSGPISKPLEPPPADDLEEMVTVAAPPKPVAPTLAPEAPLPLPDGIDASMVTSEPTELDIASLKDDTEVTVVMAPPKLAPPSPRVDVHYGGRSVNIEADDVRGLVSAAMDALGLVPVDLLGHRVRWFEMRMDGKPVTARTPVASLRGRLELHERPASTRLVRVVDDSEVRTTVRTPVSEALTVKELKRGLVDLLELLPGFDLSHGGVLLTDDSRLGEVAPSGDLELRVER